MTNGYEELGTNVEYKLSSDKKVVTFRVEVDAEPYGEGEKTIKRATTHGNVKLKGLDQKHRFSVNFFEYKPREKK